MFPITHHSRGDLLPLGAWQTPKNSGLVLIKTLLQLVEQMPSADVGLYSGAMIHTTEYIESVFEVVLQEHVDNNIS